MAKYSKVWYSILTHSGTEKTDRCLKLYFVIAVRHKERDFISKRHLGDDYEQILKRLADEFLTEEFLNTCSSAEKQGSIYECEGPFEFNDNLDDEEYY